MKKNDIKKYVLLLAAFMALSVSEAQSIYVGSNSTIFMNGNILSDHEITPSDATAVVQMTAGTTFTGLGYVDGTVNLQKDGSTIVPVGDNTTKSTITIATSNADDEADVSYNLSDPASISTTVDAALTDYYLSDTEYWQVSKVTGSSAGYVISGTSPNGSATYEGEAPSGGTILVWYDGSQWVEYTGTTATGYFSYAGENTTLSVNEVDSFDFSVYPNPIDVNATHINFNVPASVEQLSVTMYDVTGKVLKQYADIAIHAGANSIDKPKLAQGLYLLQFSFNNGAQQTTKRLIIK